MPWWHVDYQAFAGAVGYSLERFCHSIVVPTPNKHRPDLMDEVQELILCAFLAFHLLQRL
jgi:hypothetical protein